MMWPNSTVAFFSALTHRQDTLASTLWGDASSILAEWGKCAKYCVAHFPYSASILYLFAHDGANFPKANRRNALSDQEIS